MTNEVKMLLLFIVMNNLVWIGAVSNPIFLFPATVLFVAITIIAIASVTEQSRDPRRRLRQRDREAL